MYVFVCAYWREWNEMGEEFSVWKISILCGQQRVIIPQSYHYLCLAVIVGLVLSATNRSVGNDSLSIDCFSSGRNVSNLPQMVERRLHEFIFDSIESLKPFERLTQQRIRKKKNAKGCGTVENKLQIWRQKGLISAV